MSRNLRVRNGTYGYILLTCFPSWYYGEAYHLFHYLLCPTFHDIFILISLLWKWLLLIFVQHSFSLSFFFIFSLQFWLSHFSCSLSIFFSTLHFFIPTFQVINYNSHPQHMVLPWVEVHITQGWITSKTRLDSASATMNLWYWPIFWFTYPRRVQGQHSIPREVELVKKTKV